MTQIDSNIERELPLIGAHTDAGPWTTSATATGQDYYPSPGRCSLTARSGWWPEFLEDLGRYRAHHNGSRLKPLLLEQGLWALLQYRLASAVHRSTKLPPPVRAVLTLFCILTHKIAELLTGVSLPAEADIHPGQYIGHFGVVVINRAAVIHTGCNISQGVTIGISGRGERRGAPVIGPRTYIGAGAVVAGSITVGADAVIAANSLVIDDVPDCGTAVGVPAGITNRNGTAGMGLHQRPV